MQRLANYGLWSKSGSLPDLVKFIGAQYLHIVCGCFHVTTADFSSYTETIWPLELKIFTIWLVKDNICQPLISTIHPFVRTLHAFLIPLPLYFPCSSPLSSSTHTLLWDMYRGRKQTPLYSSKDCPLTSVSIHFLAPN